MADRLNASSWRNCKTIVLTVDNTVRKVTLTPGRYALYGSAAQIVRFSTRRTDSTGAVQGDALAPVSADMPVPAAGTAGAGLAHAADATDGVAEIPADATIYRFIHVAPSEFVTLYLIAPAATTCKLQGPLVWDFEHGKVIG
jgi:hypothetical protein